MWRTLPDDGMSENRELNVIFNSKIKQYFNINIKEEPTRYFVLRYDAREWTLKGEGNTMGSGRES